MSILVTRREHESTLRLIKNGDEPLGVVWKSKDKLQLHRVQGGSLADEAGAGDFLERYLTKVNGKAVGTVGELRKVMAGVPVLDMIFNDYCKEGAVRIIEKFWVNVIKKRSEMRKRRKSGAQLPFLSFPPDLLLKLQSYAKRWLAIRKTNRLRKQRSKRLAATMRQSSTLSVGRSVGVSGTFRSPVKSSGFCLSHKKLPSSMQTHSPSRRASEVVLRRASSIFTKQDLPQRRASMA